MRMEPVILGLGHGNAPTDGEAGPRVVCCWSHTADLHPQRDLKLLGGDTVNIVVWEIPVCHHVLVLLESQKLDYHTFTPKHIRHLSFVLRGLDMDSPLKDILDEH